MRKGRATKQGILDQALHLSSEVGLEALSFGVLAKRAKMSKSGLYAHFDTKEQLQREVLDAAATKFIDTVLAPALKEPRGLPRLRVLFDRWRVWEREGLSGGCLFVAAAAEFDDRPGPVRSHLVGHLLDMLGAVARTARVTVEAGHFRDDLDTEQFAYEFWGLILAHHQYGRLLDQADAGRRAETAFERLVRDASP
jgi:AcrR family transcriptional regulator